MMEWVVFALVAVRPSVTALRPGVRPNPLHGALFLVGNLFCVAVLYLMLRAEFLALAQVIVYAGAIMVLFIFAIMLLIPVRAEAGPDPLARARRLALPLAAVLGIAIVLVAGRTGGPAVGRAAGRGRGHRPAALHRFPVPLRGRPRSCSWRPWWARSPWPSAGRAPMSPGAPAVDRGGGRAAR